MQIGIENFENLEGLESSEHIRFNESQIDCITRELSDCSPSDLPAMVDTIDSTVRLFHPKLGHNINFTSLRGRSGILDGMLKNLESIYFEAPTDQVQIERIASYMSTCENLKYENWSKLSADQMIDILNELDRQIAIIEHRNPQIVKHAKFDDPNLFGVHTGNEIIINSELLAKSTLNPEILAKTLETFIHEGRHAYQSYNVFERRVHQSNAAIDSWAENMQPYSTDNRLGYYSGDPVKIPLIGPISFTNEHLTDIGGRLYYYQPTEIDARIFASDVMEKYSKICSIVWGPYDDFYWMEVMANSSSSQMELNFWKSRIKLTQEYSNDLVGGSKDNAEPSERAIYNPSFGAKEDMLPYNEKENFTIEDGVKDPFGIYAIRLNGELVSPEDFVEKPHIPVEFTQEDLQEACNKMCDILNISHLPVIITESVPNAAHVGLRGFFRFTLADDYICFNPDYAKACIEQIGNTDIILSDLAHEIGHALASKYCGNLSVAAGEKLADFISGYLNSKMGVDIDAARQWFLWQYDPVGEGNYPVSEDRWDMEGAGYYFGKYVDSSGLVNALKDPDFVKLIVDYKTEDLASLTMDQWSKMCQDSLGFSDDARNMFYNIKKYLLIKQF